MSSHCACCAPILCTNVIAFQYTFRKKLKNLCLISVPPQINAKSGKHCNKIIILKEKKRKKKPIIFHAVAQALAIVLWTKCFYLLLGEYCSKLGGKVYLM